MTPAVEPLSATQRASLADSTPLNAEQEHAVASRLNSLRLAAWERLVEAAGADRRLLTPELGRLPARPSAAWLTRHARSLAGEDMDGTGLDRAAALARSLPAPTPEATTRYLAAHAAWAICRNHFLRANLRLVALLARRHGTQLLPLEDLIQEGNIGLMTAVHRFDPTRGTRFSTYAAWWIRHAITRSLADRGRLVRLPVHVIELRRRVERARQEYLHTHGEHPDAEALAELTGASPRRLRRLHRCLADRGPSLDEPAAGTEGQSLVDTLQETEPYDPATLDAPALRTSLDRLFAALRPLDQEILRERFGLDGRTPRTLRELGTVHNLSRERIRQLQEAALSTLREGLTTQGFA